MAGLGTEGGGRTTAHDRLDLALRHCDEVTAKGKNNLYKGAQFLENETKYRLFITTYAAMRVVDDAVDVDFLGRTAEERGRTRQETLLLVDRWLGQAEAAAAGTYVTADGSMDPLVFEALNEYLSRSEIGARPWQLLARSMRRDVKEERLRTWDDFLSYCEGASVAPASIFMYILACEPHDGRTRARLPRPVETYAEDMALFCYLVHILRDLEDDARKNRQLLTIPLDLLTEAKLDLDRLADALLAGRLNELAPVTRVLVSRAEHHASRTESMLRELAPLLAAREHEILTTLYQWYLGTFGTVTERYLGRAPVVRGEAAPYT